mmetsp:Transcript_49994/g.89754  ORF Transcript_49994/g.89754 Transcript_49994/m.89754 type:complete len:428 (-) Transcript_49994:141-1424(-)|eukprot:CAMPEP_0197627186 /NCGR_PEP_ID=MMETSP1338-20131121/5863_1 /TAXON_ID=43686 ORGANISM="Pelagodinium beii, Strain RCC1491" /NCGR_SAMPLE_ID=MMETSP1338 /ASSEMBLY_ACC=CAM_ASM_000754 /LENGTH=427 /DNA_ID=CAMNT_0043197829 /DNA_START=27 /DNA_END=1310 /DNA_ORIENTATION=+
MAEKHVRECFTQADANSDGQLDSKEFASLLKKLDPDKWSDDNVSKFFGAADLDNNGKLDLQEVLHWIFKSHAASPSSPGGDDSSSSSSSSDSEDAREAHRANRKARSMKKEEKPTDVEMLYTLLTSYEGRDGGTLKLEDLIQVFAHCKGTGMDPRLPELVLQQVESHGEPEDVSALELGHLFAMLQENRSATEEDARTQISNVKDVCRGMDQKDLKAVGLDGSAVVGYGIFKQLLPMLSATMCIDKYHLLAAFSWSKTNVFELPEEMAIQVMVRLFMKVDGEDEHVLEQRVSNNDFNRMLFTVDLIDPSAKRGIPSGRIAIIFQEVLKTMPKKLAERRRARAVGKARTKKKVERKHTHKSISGRTQLSVLMEALFQSLPAPKAYYNAMDMSLRLLEVADGKAKLKKSSSAKSLGGTGPPDLGKRASA